MNDAQRRATLFWLVCIPTRLSFAAIGHIPLTRVASTMVAYNYLCSGNFNHHTHGFFGGRVWWAKQRELHGLLFALHAISGNPGWLFADAGIGALNWLDHM